MKHARLLALLLSLSPFALFAQTITSVTPSSGPTTGGTEVVITGSGLGLPPGFACVAPCPAVVSFGGIEVTVRDERDTRLVAVTPPNTPGTVNVTVRTGDGRRVTAPNAFTYVADTQEAQYEALLLPVYLDGSVPGNKGSIWQTDFWIRNAGPQSVQLAPWLCPATQVCLPISPLTYNLQSGETLHNLPVPFRAPSNNPSRMLYVERNRGDVSTSLRVRDTSRESLNAGTELPVVSIADMRAQPISLLNVPADPRFRQHLRIYDAFGNDTQFTVRIYENFAGMSTAPPIRQLQVTASGGDTGTFRMRIAYAEVPSLQDLLPANVAPASLRVEIEPLAAGSRFWAFVSVTNNDTQAVTLITPR